MASDQPGASRTFDDLYQESSQAQRKFAARVTVYDQDEALQGRFPIPRQYGRHEATSKGGREEDKAAVIAALGEPPEPGETPFVLWLSLARRSRK